MFKYQIRRITVAPLQMNLFWTTYIVCQSLEPNEETEKHQQV